MKLIVLHSSKNWLKQTKTWLYNQVYYLPVDVENHIVCQWTENLDQFYIPNIHCSRWRGKMGEMFPSIQGRLRKKYLAKVVKKTDANILHSHFGNEGWLNIEAAKKAGLKHIVTFYGYDLNYLPRQDARWYERYLEMFEYAHCILCEGSHMAQNVIALGCSPHKVKVHHLGVEVDDISFVPRSWKPFRTLRILIAGSFREKKGIPYALEALAQLHRKIDLTITIIGDADDTFKSQAEKQKILKTIAEHNLQSKVRLLGYQPHATLFEEAYKHHIFISPSVTSQDGDTEGGAPVSIIEMAATGMPIISTIHCDIPEVIQHGQTGLLASERNVNELVHNLNWLINNPEQWKPMVEAGRKRVESMFNVRYQGEQLMRIYEAIFQTGELPK